MVSEMVLDHGPPGLVENVPCGEFDTTVTDTGAIAVNGAPLLDVSPSVIGPEGVPAWIVCGGVVKVSSGCDQTWNAFHASLKCAPWRSPTHETFWPPGPQAALPGLLATSVCAESRMAAPSRSRIAFVWFAKSVDESPEPLRGAQAKPK